MIYYSRTDKGTVRNQNEDFIYAPQGSDGFFAVVADGMGGHNAGEVASRIAVDTIIDKLSRSNPDKINKDDIIDALKAANMNVWHESLQNSEKKGMGSTATVAVFNNGSATIGHVGDSRAYLFRDCSLSQITKDHSYVQMLVDHGYITEYEAANHPNKNVITRAIGAEDIIEVDVYTIKIRKNDVVLLCSDGLNAAVSDEEIKTILSGEIKSAADKLVEAAISHGGADNISVIVAFMDGDMA